MRHPTFEQFNLSCQERGYTERVYKEQNNFILYTHNGIKCQIRRGDYTFGWSAKAEDIAEMRKRFFEQGFEEKKGKRAEKRKDDKDYINIHFDGDILENFWILVNTIEGIDTIVKKVRGQAIKPIPKEVSERNIFEKIAKRFKYYIDNDDGFALDKWREQLEGDSIDHLITIGESVNRTKENTYREHIVPCVLIYNKIITMLQDNRPVTEVAQMIKSNLAIVLITNEEAQKIDGDLDLQTTMPEGWQFGDDVFARLNAADIQLK